MSQTSSSHSPFRDGFAALMHEPLLLPAELVWRWCCGFSALALGIVSIGLFLDSLKLSAVDEFLIQTLQPRLLDSALRHIFRGSLTRFLVEQAVLILGIMLLWALAASAGRAATLRRLVAMFSTDTEEEPQPMRWDFAPILALQLLRAMWSLIALAVAAGLFVYGTVMATNEHPLRAALALSFGIGLAGLTGLALNWCFGVAPLFCIRNGAGAMEAMDQTVDFANRHAGRLCLLALGFFALRLLWAGTMCLAFFAPLSWMTHIGGRWTSLLMAMVALIYFAGADLLYLARLGAYVSLAEEDARPEVELFSPHPVQPTEFASMLGLA